VYPTCLKEICNHDKYAIDHAINHDKYATDALPRILHKNFFLLITLLKNNYSVLTKQWSSPCASEGIGTTDEFSCHYSLQARLMHENRHCVAFT